MNTTVILTRRPTVVCAALLTVAVGRLSAQDLAVGGRLGALAAAVWHEDREANDLVKPKFGLQIGGAVAYRSKSILSVQAELWYVQKGWKETRAGGGRRLAYVELPLLLTATAPWNTAPQLLAGVSASLELACSVTGVREVGSVRETGSVGCDDPQVEWNHKKAQFAVWSGMGVRRRFGSSHLDIQLLASFHLTNVNHESLPRGYSRLVSLAVSAAYMITVGGRAR